jgi:hypothetical protein
VKKDDVKANIGALLSERSQRDNPASEYDRIKVNQP